MDIKVYDKDFTPISILDEYESFIWTTRYQECGDFEIYTLATPELLDLLRLDRYISVNMGDTVDPTIHHMMVIEDIKIESDAENGDKLIVSGRSLESILDRRVVWGTQTFHSSDNKGIDVESIIYSLLDKNVINPSNEKRAIKMFAINELTPGLSGVKMEVSYSGENIYEILCELVKLCGYGFEIVYSEYYKMLLFSLYYGTDRSRDQSKEGFVIFSPEYDNLLNSNCSLSTTSYKNVALVGGEAPEENKARVYVGTYLNNVGETSDLDRREMFVDASGVSSKDENGKQLSSTTYKNMLISQGKEQIGRNIIKTAFDGDVDHTSMFKLYENYNIGDIVEVADAYGNSMKARVTEIIISDDTADGFKIYPSFTNIEEEVTE